MKENKIEPENTEYGLRFFLENWSFLLWDDPEDPTFFRLTLPGVFDVTDDNFAEAIIACNQVNMDYKVVKALIYSFDGEKEDEEEMNVWICFEQVLDSTPEVSDLMPRAVNSMINAAHDFVQKMSNVE
ncbi:MAG: hypothetical protein MJZ94_03650 [Bacteroidales bacterium]|nr:hypothetical protein [Bacteroidales bacterium]